MYTSLIRLEPSTILYDERNDCVVSAYQLGAKLFEHP